MHFLMRAAAVCIFPGGFGTMDEMFECITLIQTGRMAQVPVLLFGREFWDRVMNLDALAEAGTISAEDLKLFRFVSTAEEAIAAIRTCPRRGCAGERSPDAEVRLRSGVLRRSSGALYMRKLPSGLRGHSDSGRSR